VTLLQAEVLRALEAQLERVIGGEALLVPPDGSAVDVLSASELADRLGPTGVPPTLHGRVARLYMRVRRWLPKQGDAPRGNPTERP
jgi:hypothetical protein